MPMFVHAAAAPAVLPYLRQIEFRMASAQGPILQAWKPGDPIRLAPPTDAGLVTARQDDPPVVAPAPPHFSIARGFGDQVPLSFAASQIVPAHVRVSFGPGVQPESPVTWQGDRPWNQVLATAVAPLGYRIQMGRMAVTVLRKD